MLLGLKTGSTSLALYNLSASATRDNFSLIAVIMKAPSTKIRFSEAEKLLDYGFNTYSFYSFGNKGDTINNIPVDKGVSSSVDLVLSDTAGTIVKKGNERNIEQTISLPDRITAPVNENQKVGEITFSLDGEILSSIDIIAKESVDKLNLFNVAKKVYYSWIDLLRT